MPKVGIFVVGIMSLIVAISILPHFGRDASVTTREHGVVPKLHWSDAPFVTNFPILLNIYRSFITYIHYFR